MRIENMIKKTANVTFWMQISFRLKYCAAQLQAKATGCTEKCSSMTCLPTRPRHTSPECANLARCLEITSCSGMKNSTLLASYDQQVRTLACTAVLEALKCAAAEEGKTE